MRVARRNMLKASGAAMFLGITNLRARTPRNTSLAVYDSRLAGSRAFAAEARRKGIALVDVATTDHDLWRALRQAPSTGNIVGLTRWSDYVTARGALEDQRKRLRSEIANGPYFLWEMA